jgi:hypothetical protein
VAGVWRRLRNEKFHNIYAPPNIIRVMKSRKLKWPRRVLHMDYMRHTYDVLVGKPE